MIEMITEYLTHLFNKSALVEQGKREHYDQVINGSYEAEDTAIGMDICINGQAVLRKNVRVEKKLLINGRLIAHLSRIMSDLTVNGASSLDNTQINGVAKFRGSLEALSTIFSNKIEVLSSLAEFENSKIQDITFKKLPRNNIVQCLKLVKNTEVYGDILFEAGNGEVLCDDTSKVHGQVIGGKVIHFKGE